MSPSSSRRILSLVLGLALVLSLGTELNAQPTSKSKTPTAEQIERITLGLPPDGAPIEAAFFAYCWQRYMPAELCVMIRDERLSGSTKRIQQAYTVYTKADKVFAHSDRYGRLELTGLQRADLKDEAKLRTAFATACATEQPRPLEALEASVQMKRAFSLMHHGALGTEFPVALSDIDLKIKRPDGSFGTSRVEALCVDFAGDHFVYRPEDLGCMAFELPKNPRTKLPYSCVAHGDWLEALLFVLEYRAAHPQEKARVLFADEANRVSSNGTAGAAFTAGKKLFFFSVFFGELEHPDRSAKDFAAPELAKELKTTIHKAYQKSWETKKGGSGVPYAVRPDELYEVMPPRIPQSLSGDSQEMQLRRAVLRARALGIEASVVDTRSNNAPQAIRLRYEEIERIHRPDNGTALYQAPMPWPSANAVPGRIQQQPVRVGVNIQPRNREPKLPEGATKPKPRSGGATTVLEHSAEDIVRLTEQAEKGNVTAMEQLGDYYLSRSKDPAYRAKGIDYLEKAAMAGEPASALTVARLFDTEGKPESDMARAFKYYKIAALAGFREAQYNTGAMLAAGRGIKRDHIEGLAWLIVAGQNGAIGPGEGDLKRSLVKRPKDIAAAEQRAQEIIAELLERGVETKKNRESRIQNPAPRMQSASATECYSEFWILWDRSAFLG